MRMQLLMSSLCVLGAVACGSSTSNQSAANDPSSMQDPSTGSAQASGSTSTTSASVTAPTMTATGGTSAMNGSGSATTTNNGIPNAASTSGTGVTPSYTAPSNAPVGATPVAPPPTVGSGSINTAQNKQGGLTPMNQGNSQSETQITAAVRRQVVADKSLSFNAKNVKIITQGTKVTLRGAVKSDAEKSTIENTTRHTAGVTDVDDQIEVKP